MRNMSKSSHLNQGFEECIVGPIEKDKGECNKGTKNI